MTMCVCLTKFVTKIISSMLSIRSTYMYACASNITFLAQFTCALSHQCNNKNFFVCVRYCFDGAFVELARIVFISKQVINVVNLTCPYLFHCSLPGQSIDNSFFYIVFLPLSGVRGIQQQAVYCQIISNEVPQVFYYTTEIALWSNFLYSPICYIWKF